MWRDWTDKRPHETSDERDIRVEKTLDESRAVAAAKYKLKQDLLHYPAILDKQINEINQKLDKIMNHLKINE